MSVAPEITSLGAVRRTRPRPQPIKLSSEEVETGIPQRVMQFLEDDERAQGQDLELRKQRYAKLMQYTTEVSEPFEGASNVQLPDIMSAVLSSEDTLQNAVMTTRPVANAKAVNPANADRERKTDLLLDHQLFVEQPGEELIEQMSMNFFRDGSFTVLTRWVRDFRKVLTVRNFEAIPLDTPPVEHFLEILQGLYSAEDSKYRPLQESEGWDWVVIEGKTEYLARFYTEDDGEVILQIEGTVEVYTGPKACVYDYEDVLAPYWALNLQPPSPSNPHGAPHVILCDYPTKEEILRGIEAGFYDLTSRDEIDSFSSWKDWTDGDRELDRTRRVIRGVAESEAGLEEVPDHQQIKRLICFDVWEGLDVVWTVLVGPQTVLLRARPLTEFAPGIPPRRPIAHACMIPVQGTWRGMGLPELMESMHDYLCESFNSMNDASQFELFPFFKYRQGSTLKPEDVVLEPGGGIPCNDVDRDLKFERANSQAMAIGVNRITLGQRFMEELTLLGDLQFGRIPAGKSSALRTSSGIQQVLAQGEARPARILRRFFRGFLDIHRDMYRLDRHFLPERKKFRVVGVSQPGEDPFVEIHRMEDLSDFVFDFQANVLNSSKVALQSGLSEALSILVNPLMMQLGITDGPTAYRLATDLLRALGLNPEHYAREPEPGAAQEPLYAEEVLSTILAGGMPEGSPAEPDTQTHVQRLQELANTPDDMGITLLATLSAAQQERLGNWLTQVREQAIAAQRQAQLLQAAQQFAAGQQQRSPDPGGTAASNPNQPTVSSATESLDESLPAGTGTPQ